jgi:hypothetical protein
MIVDDLDPFSALAPHKANAPLIIDPDAVLPARSDLFVLLFVGRIIYEDDSTASMRRTVADDTIPAPIYCRTRGTEFQWPNIGRADRSPPNPLSHPAVAIARLGEVLARPQRSFLSLRKSACPRDRRDPEKAEWF